MNSSYPTPQPTPEEITSVKVEEYRLGWLRSRLLGRPWPREGVSSCGRLGCAVCDVAGENYG